MYEISTFLHEHRLITFLIGLVIMFPFFYGKDKKSKLELEVDRKNKELINFILTNNIRGVIKSLERHQAVNPKTKSGESAMELAILKNNKYIVAYLIKYGAIPNAREIKLALKCGNKEIINMVRTGNHLRYIEEYRASI